MSGPFEMPAGYDAWKTRTPWDDQTFECTDCDDQGCDRCAGEGFEAARDLEDLDERCGDDGQPDERQEWRDFDPDA